MHSSIGPWEEARKVYVDQSGLAERLGSDVAEAGEPLVIYDIGMGIAANALAAIEVADAVKPAERARGRPVEIISFENDLAGIELALGSGGDFPWLVRHREKVEAVLRTGVWESAGMRSSALIRWRLVLRDFRALSLAPLPAPEIIFYDFYSPRTNPELWGKESFEKLWAATAPRRGQGKSSVLVTYCTSTAARSALLLAGFAVGRGIATEAKRETTIAATRCEELSEPVQKEWLRRLMRSSKPFPLDLSVSGLSESEALARICAAPQFRPDQS